MIQPGGLNQMVIVCAGTRWHGMPASEHHIAERLTQWASVLYVDPPMSLISARSAVGRRLEIVNARLARLTPVVLPGMRRSGIVRMTEELTRIHIRSALRQLGARATVRILASDLPVYERFGDERRVLFATDDFAAGAELMGLQREQVRRHELRLARDTDLVISVSAAVAEKWSDLGCAVRVIPNGCDTERFARTDDAPWPADVRLRPPIAGFTGQINERLDIELLDAVAARGRSVLLVGPTTRTFDPRRLDALLNRPNVQWVGPKPFVAMPSYLRSIHVGLTPYIENAFNRASFPLKTIEYLAAGRAAVSTDLPTARSLGTEHVILASGPRAFADAVDGCLEAPLTTAAVAHRRAFAESHGWAARGREFAEAIGVVESGVRAAVAKR
jgi:teichuronic acid biosynthesis glycosyltransferase TuaH